MTKCALKGCNKPCWSGHDYCGKTHARKAQRDAWPQRLKFFHGTTWENAVQIRGEGFIKSSDGCLGAGVYVCRQEKATKFARKRAQETGQDGGLITVLCSIRKPKFVNDNDDTWQEEGYDACRAEKTSVSPNMEWCIRDPSQITVLGICRI